MKLKQRTNIYIAKYNAKPIITESVLFMREISLSISLLPLSFPLCYFDCCVCMHGNETEFKYVIFKLGKVK